LAIDPSVLPKVRPNVEATDRMIPASIPGPDRSRPLRQHDLADALREMELGGYAFDPATGRGGYPQPIDYITVPDSFDQAAGEIFQQQLARVGLRVQLRLVSYATWLADVSTRRRVAMGWTGWHADFPDPSNFFSPILTTAAIQNEGSHNVAFFSNPELDTLMTRAQRELDREARMKLFERAEQIVCEEAPWIPVYTARSFELWHPYLRGYAPNPIIPQRFTDAWLDAQARGATPARGGR
jgi:ABC-type transport system substrate-binding protein